MTDSATTPEAAERAQIRLIADVLAIGMFKRHPIYSRETPPMSFSEEFHRNFGTWETAQEIAAALAAQEGGGERVTERWEPMETAPMDGTVIQFLQGGEVFAGFAGDDPDHPWQFLDRNGRQAFVNGFHHKFSPRWWRPLAEAPKEAALRAAQEGTGNG